MPRTAREVYEIYRTMEYEPFLRAVRGTYLFEVEQIGRWFIAVQEGAVSFDDKLQEADCVIRCSEEDFVEILEGRRNLITAVLQGRVEVAGDMALAQKFHGLVSTAFERRRSA